MAKKLIPDLRKDFARTLFIQGQSKPEIADRAGISENTLSKWVDEEKWDAMRKSLTTTKTEQLSFLYEILAKMTAEGRAAMDDDDPKTNPDYDGITKITRAIERLEKETNVGEMIQTGIDFLTFMKGEDIDVAKLFNKWFMIFIQEKIK
jgi:predicted transcriptional regulator